MSNSQDLINLADQVMVAMEGFIGCDESPVLQYLKNNNPNGKSLDVAIQGCIDYLYDSECEDADYYQGELDEMTSI